MKHVKHMLVAVLTVFLAAVLAVPAFAGTGSIKVTPPDGTQASSSNEYKLYKVFDAVTDGTNYSYKLTGTHTDVPAGFTLDDAGNVYIGTAVASIPDGENASNYLTVTAGGGTKYIKKWSASDELTAAQISAIAAYIASDSPIDTQTVSGTNPAVFTSLDDGYYYVTTTSGTLVVVNSTLPAVDVKDKNEVPPMDKKITQANSINSDDPSTELDESGKTALAQVGSSVEYTLTVTKKKGAENYVVKDQMGTGLKYNKDVKVTVNGAEVAPSSGEVKTFEKTTETDSNLVITFDNDYMASLANDTVVTIKYTATVTSEALHTDAAKNTAWLEYGHTPGQNKTPVVETETYNATLNVVKTNGNNEPLAGAGFILQDKNTKKYYKITDNVVSWVDTEADATEKTTAVVKTYYTDEAKNTLAAEGEVTEYFTSEAKISFTGLPNGTYTLIEKTVPTGYNKAANSDFTINDADSTTVENRLQSTTVINNQGTELPSTGGMGTTILYTVGGIMVIAGIVMFLTKRRMASIEK